MANQISDQMLPEKPGAVKIDQSLPGSDQKPIISISRLRKEYPMGDERVVALAGINLTVDKGEICCIFGPSGSGKSTLLNMMAGMEKPTIGTVEIAGSLVSSLNEGELALFRQNHTGFIFQAYNLLPGLDALSNVALPLTFKGLPAAKRNRAARAMLERVGLKDRIHHFPSQMSGGQQQRVGIARAFITRPDVIFADEPTGNLDSKTRIEIMNMMRRFSRSLNQTIILVTHDAEMASYADHIVTLLDGRIIKEEYSPAWKARKENQLS